MDLSLIVSHAVKEDMPAGDITTDSLDRPEYRGLAELKAKEDMVLSGQEAFVEVFKQMSPNSELTWHFNDGDLVLKGQIICSIQGNLIQVLKAERVALNFLGYLSGIATLTRCFVNEVKHTKTKILDTRKTIPMYRDLSKNAVKHGGGENHRMNLSDKVLIKENHIVIAGSLERALERIKMNHDGPIEIETKNVDEVKRAVELSPARIMLDNMDNETTKEALKFIPSSIESEASGNMTIERVKSVAELGVDFISVGALTHSAPTADVSLLFHWKE